MKELSDSARLTCDWFSASCWYRKCSTICYDPIVEIKRREKVIIEHKTAPLANGRKTMSERNLTPEDFEQGWDLLKFRIAEKTSWGKKEILNVMATIETLISYGKAEQLHRDKRKREEISYGKKE